jgi:peptidoglycan hydrolase-like protein with peptidoglycan-binding domain
VKAQLALWSAVSSKFSPTEHPASGTRRQVQSFRNESGDPNKGVQVDGIFGPQTDSAVRGFQHAVSLDVPSVAVDGIVGPITWQALISGMLSG